MALSTAKKKIDVMTEGVSLAKRLLSAIADANEWTLNLTANNFESGGTDAIVQDDIPAASSEILHLTPNLIEQLRLISVAVVGALTAQQRNNLRRVAQGVLKSQ